MGIIKGFLCSSCGFEKSYYLGVGFRGGRDKILYSCTDCNTGIDLTFSLCFVGVEFNIWHSVNCMP